MPPRPPKTEPKFRAFSPRNNGAAYRFHRLPLGIKDGFLVQPGWNPTTRRKLEALINKGTKRNLPVVFDFDNTIVCGDIGEAVLAVLARSRRLTPERVSKTLCPAFRVRSKSAVRMEQCADITQYYEAYLAPTSHGLADPAPLANAYVFATEVLEGLRPSEVTNATRIAYRLSRPGEVRWIQVTPGNTAFPAPFFYPEMVELIGVLMQRQFDVWIVSASNVWSVRWMILRGLNPLLEKLGTSHGVPPDRIVGISSLLSDAAGHLYKDSVLVREDAQYANLDQSRLKAFRLTSRLQFPVPIYSGKVSCLHDAIGCRPFLCVGDSPADHPMMVHSENRLWIARREKPESQRATLALMKKTGPRGWLWQTTSTRDRPGFTPDHEPRGI